MEHDAVDKIKTVLNQTSIGNILGSLEERGVMAYLHDLIYLEFKICSTNVLEVSR